MPLAETAGGALVAPSRASVADRTYALARSAYIYFAPDTLVGDRTDPPAKIREFLRYVLSRQGQEDVLREGDYFPLTARMASEQQGPTATRLLEPPGFMAMHYGMRTPIAVLLSHAVFGAMLGAFYRMT